jgi:uncharacterized protein YndB with AHSA1/START domain
MQMASPDAKFKNGKFTITCVFDAARADVWAAWTEPERIKRWFGPKGCAISRCTVDLRPGGAACYGMEFQGNKTWGKWTYRELKAPEWMVAIVAFTDETGEKIIEHPGMKDWPREILSVVTFTEEGSKTRITVEWTAYHASGAEQRVFEQDAPSMEQGWGGSFEQLTAFLGKP